MLTDTQVVATIAVRNLGKSRDFYERILGLEPDEVMDDMVVSYRCGSSPLLVYESVYAGGYGATVATWTMKSGIEDIVAALSAKGVTFEHYADNKDMALNGDIHESGKMKNAWFKDPDGNILCLVQHP